MALSTAHLLSFVFLVCFLLNLGSSLIQEIQILENYGDNLEGNVYTFRHSVPDSTQFNITDFKQACAKGSWRGYSQKYYVGTVRGWDVTSLSCSTGAMPFLSFRFLGSGNTSQDGVSLYAAENQEGQEVYINRWPFAGITMPIKSVAWSGASNFTFFEGTNFDGTSVCVQPGSRYWAAESEDNILQRWNLTTVGSILKGCNNDLSVPNRILLRAESERNKYNTNY